MSIVSDIHNMINTINHNQYPNEASMVEPRSTVCDDEDNDRAHRPGALPGQQTSTTRLDITAASMKLWNADQKQEFIDTLVDRCNNGNTNNITSVLISGQKLQKVLTKTQIIALLKSLSKIHTITEFNCFYGKCNTLTTDLLAMSLPPNVQTLTLWNFRSFSTNFIMTLRQRITISKMVLNFPFERTNQMKWGCFDFGIMALCSMEHLRILQIRCVLPDGARYIRQDECIISPEAMILLLNSTSIQHLYLENCGLLDDHMDEVCNELPNNKTLVSLHLKDNLFSDDCLYTLGRLLPIAPKQFQSLDVTGVSISTVGGTAAASGMLQNTTVLSLKLENSWSSCDIYEDDDDDDDENDNVYKKDYGAELWMKQINHQLLCNNAALRDKTKTPTIQEKMIPSIKSYVPPRQLVVDSQHMNCNQKKKSIADVQSISDAVSIVYENMNMVLRDVLPSKASSVVSTISGNVTSFYNHQQQMKQQQQQKHSPGEEPQRVGISSIACLSMIQTTDVSGENRNHIGSAFSCSFD